jgi:hypothetical protein
MARLCIFIDGLELAKGKGNTPSGKDSAELEAGNPQRRFGFEKRRPNYLHANPLRTVSDVHQLA